MKQFGERAKKIWIVDIKSESGDDYGSHVFGFNPDKGDYLYDWCLENFPGEFDPDGNDDGPGKWGSYLHVTVYESAVIELED